VNTVTIAPANVDSVVINDYSNLMDAAPWTLETLTALVAEATRRLGLHQDNGQVADAPNARAVRWYQSQGLVRRPQQRGRVAYYGVAQLREIVAIKRLQSQGLALDEVQRRLLGMSDEELRVTAGVPADLEVTAVVIEPPARGFWHTEAVDAVVDAAVVADTVTVTGPAAATAVAATRIALDHPAGVTVVFPTTRAPTADDVQAILSAVVSQLTARGLLAASTTTPSTSDGTEKP
jgi:DNA-binding transcriptional MerR regulator